MQLPAMHTPNPMSARCRRSLSWGFSILDQINLTGEESIAANAVKDTTDFVRWLLNDMPWVGACPPPDGFDMSRAAVLDLTLPTAAAAAYVYARRRWRRSSSPIVEPGRPTRPSCCPGGPGGAAATDQSRADGGNPCRDDRERLLPAGYSGPGYVRHGPTGRTGAPGVLCSRLLFHRPLPREIAQRLAPVFARLRQSVTRVHFDGLCRAFISRRLGGEKLPRSSGSPFVFSSPALAAGGSHTLRAGTR